MYKKILVATMGEYMDEILDHTVEIIGEKTTEVIGIYVVDTSVPVLTPKKVKEMMTDELTERGKEILDVMQHKFQSPSRYMIDFHKLLLMGDPAEEIVKTAGKEEVDLIVLGTGKDRLDKRLLGSVSEKVIHSAPCTVLLVRTGSKPI
jgi:nucleotide-binding universal stress UspA family protein